MNGSALNLKNNNNSNNNTNNDDDDDGGNNKNLMPRKLFYRKEDFKGHINSSCTSLVTNGLFPRVNF